MYGAPAGRVTHAAKAICRVIPNVQRSHTTTGPRIEFRDDIDLSDGGGRATRLRFATHGLTDGAWARPTSSAVRGQLVAVTLVTGPGSDARMRRYPQWSRVL
jgi:hypothetical protein